MKSYPFHILLLATLFAVAMSSQGEPLPVALLSVATDAAWLEISRPESRRPPVALAPLEAEPWSMEQIREMGDAAQAEMIRENGAVRARNRQIEEENALRIQRAVSADLTDTRSRQRVARANLLQTPLGQAALSAADTFASVCSSNANLAVLAPQGESFYLPDVDGAALVSLLFQEPKKTPPPANVPGTGFDAIRLTLPVMLKVEEPDGRVRLKKSFERELVVPNTDSLLGKGYERALTRLANDAVVEVVRLLAENDITAPAESTEPPKAGEK